jgi:hypothetical protein
LVGDTGRQAGDDGALHDGLSRDAAARARAEWRDEQEHAAADAAIVRRHGLDLRARLREAMARGDRVWVRAAPLHVAGFVIEVDDDLLSLRTMSFARIDVRLDPVPRLLFGLVDAAARHGSTPPLSSGGFRGRMLAAESLGDQYSVIVAGEPDALGGRIAVGRDHLEVVQASGGGTVVSMALVVAVSAITSASV